MINSRAQFPIFIVITGIVALVVAAIVIASTGLLGHDIASIFRIGTPSLNETGTLKPGINYVGILISPIAKPVSGSTGAVSRPNALLYYLVGHRNLSQRTGDGWTESINLGTKSLDAVAFRDTLATFYFSTSRMGNPQLTLDNGQPLSVSITSGGLFEGHGLTLWYNGSTPVYLAPNNLFYKDDLSRRKASGYDSVSLQAAAWRDQILQGYPCEKFIALTFKEGDQEVTHLYTLKKDEVENGFYLYVDLDQPAFGNELYGEGCYSNAA